MSEEMSFDEAVAALQESSAAEVAADAEPLTVATPEASESQPAPSESAPPAPAEAEAESFTKADLASLLDGVDDPAARERIETAYKSFQGDYTRKTQDLAAEKQALQALGDPASIQEALEFQAALRDPTNWPQVHAELTNALQEMGYSPAQAESAATAKIQDAAQSTATPGRPSLDDLDDPELEPVKAYLQGLEGRLDAMTEEREAERTAQQNEQLLLALQGELVRQETTLRQLNPSYDDTDITSIYELSSYYGGNLFQAEVAYKAQNQRALERYLAQKGGTQDTPGVHPFSGGGVVSGQPIEPTEMSDKDVDALAVRLIDESGALNSF